MFTASTRRRPSAGWWAALSGVVLAATAAPAEVRIAGLSADKARYAPGAPVEIRATLENASGPDWTGRVDLSFWRLSKLAGSAAVTAQVPQGRTVQVTLVWNAPAEDGVGYLVEAEAAGSKAYTAVDVSSDWRRQPRYGFLTAFADGVTADDREAMIDLLAREYHLSVLQFYDWMWRHENVIQVDPGTGNMVPVWEDWSGLWISTTAIRHAIDRAQARGIAAMAYFQVYVALDLGRIPGREYETLSGVDPEWGLYADAAHAYQHNHEGLFYIFDPTNVEWQAHLAGECLRALCEFPFAGIHFDQLGKRRPAYTWSGREVDLELAFPRTLALAKDALSALPAAGPQPRPFAFNIVDGKVDGWAVADALWNAPCEFSYSEIWNAQTYSELHKFMRRAREEADGKALVVAAYMNKDNPGVPCGSFHCFEDDSVLLADAAIFASGAFHIEIGDYAEMLHEPNFRDASRKMSPDLRSAMRRFYDFAVAYEDLLFGEGVSYADRGVGWIDLGGLAVSGCGLPGTIWCIVRRTKQFEVIHWIDLRGETDEKWRNEISGVPPPVLSDFDATYWLGPRAQVRGVFVASPERDGGKMREIPHTVAPGAGGAKVSFRVPGFRHWSLVAIDRTLDRPPSGIYEAEEGCLGGGVEVQDLISGRSGTGYAAKFDGALASAGFAIDVASGGAGGIELRYANLSSAEGRFAVILDGEKAGEVRFAPAGAGVVWRTAVVPVPIREGPHQVVAMPVSPPSWSAIDCLRVLPPANGLRGQYFAEERLKARAFTRLDARVDFDWKDGAPDGPGVPAGFPSDGFSARWSGWIDPPQTGAYRFHVRSDDGARLWLDGELLIDRWILQVETRHDSREVALQAGRRYRVSLEHFDHTGRACVHLEWSRPGAAPSVVPASALRPLP